MKLPLFIARRYLKSPKKQSAINIISVIGVVGICIGTAAMITVLSVFNGIDVTIAKSVNSLSPSLTISPMEGKFMEVPTTLIDSIASLPEVSSCNPVIEERAMAKYRGRMLPVMVKGVEESFTEEVGLDDRIIAGDLLFEEPILDADYRQERGLETSVSAEPKEEGASTEQSTVDAELSGGTNNGEISQAEEQGGAEEDEKTYRKPLLVAGIGAATDLRLEFRQQYPILLYYPARHAKTASSSSLTVIEAGLGGVFTSMAEEERGTIYCDLQTAESLFEVEGELSKCEIYLKDESMMREAKREISNIVGERYRVIDKFEADSGFYSMMATEKLLIFLIMLFIILIASFNTVASISMLLIDKREDLFTYQSMGMTRREIARIFNTEGIIMVAIGVVAGIILGALLCLLQEHFGLITLGDGNYITEAYPVELWWSDILILLITIMAVGSLATILPVRYWIKKWL